VARYRSGAEIELDDWVVLTAGPVANWDYGPVRAVGAPQDGRHNQFYVEFWAGGGGCWVPLAVIRDASVWRCQADAAEAFAGARELERSVTVTK
jgi:hypothetical protein